MSKKNSNTDESSLNDPICSQEPYPLIEAGEYEASCVASARKKYREDEHKVYLTFQITTFGEHFEKRLFMAMKDYGRKVRRGSKFFTAWIIANGGIKPRRGERMSLKVFKNKVFRIYVDTVKPKFDTGHPKPESCHYSKVQHILELVAGGERGGSGPFTNANASTCANAKTNANTETEHQTPEPITRDQEPPMKETPAPDFSGKFNTGEEG